MPIPAQTHRLPDGTGLPCVRESHGACRVCDLIDRDGPHYREDYRRLFHPEEFPAPTTTTPAPVIAAVSRPAPPSPPAIPLAGDLVAALTHRLGADRAAKWVARKLGTDCGCSRRQAALNRADAAARRYLARFGGPTPTGQSGEPR